MIGFILLYAAGSALTLALLAALPNCRPTYRVEWVISALAWPVVFLALMLRGAGRI